MSKKYNSNAVKTKIQWSLIKVRDDFVLDNKELFGELFAVIPEFMNYKIDKRTKEGKEAERILEDLNSISERIKQFLN